MRRPFAITLFALAVLSLAAHNAGRALVALQQFEFMQSLGLSALGMLLTLTGLAWALGFGAAAIGLYRLKRWARRWMLLAIVLYQVNLWLIRLAFEQSAYEWLTRPADAAISILSIALIWAILYWPPVRRAFT